MFSLSSLSITHSFIRGAALHVVVVIALGMSPVLVGFSHTLPDGLLLLSRDGTTEARDLLKGRHFGPRRVAGGINTLRINERGYQVCERDEIHQRYGESVAVRRMPRSLAIVAL
jgi:hypothetical protein